MNSIFHPVDMQTWPRAETFRYFTKSVTPTGYTIHLDMDATRLREALKARKTKFFPAFMYLVSRAVAEQPELRLAKRNGQIGVWDTLTPQYPVFHEDDKTITFLWTEYNEDFSRFYAAYLDDQQRYGRDHGIFSQKGAPPENRYVVSCAPWLSFTGISMHLESFENYFVPMVVAGGFFQRDGKTLLPVSVTIHHAAADGYQMKLFFDSVQSGADAPETWLP